MDGPVLPEREESRVTYVAFDPGETTGYALFDVDGNIMFTSHVKAGQNGSVLFARLKNIILPGTKVVIMENYRLFPWKSNEQAWSSLTTVRYIGAIEYYCYTREIKLVYQDPSVKAIAYKWAGIQVPKQKLMTHETDAYVHGVYYLQNEGIRKPQQGRVT